MPGKRLTKLNGNLLSYVWSFQHSAEGDRLEKSGPTKKQRTTDRKRCCCRISRRRRPHFFVGSFSSRCHSASSFTFVFSKVNASRRSSLAPAAKLGIHCTKASGDPYTEATLENRKSSSLSSISPPDLGEGASGERGRKGNQLSDGIPRRAKETNAELPTCSVA